MTSFGDVNVGDKVRLTHENGAVEGVVSYGNDSRVDLVFGRSAMSFWASHNWSVEVLEPAPKPLPTEPGLYADTFNEYMLTEGGRWKLVTAGGVYDRTEDDMHGGSRENLPLQRLVPESAVEEARAEVVKEIVAHLLSVRLTVGANEVEANFGVRGKA